jgi:hypothetical protein
VSISFSPFALHFCTWHKCTTKGFVRIRVQAFLRHLKETISIYLPGGENLRQMNYPWRTPDDTQRIETVTEYIWCLK